MAGTTRYSISKQDYIDAGRATFIRALRKPRFLTRMSIITAIGLMAGYGLGWWLGDPAAAMFAGVGALYGLTAVLTIIFGTYLLLPRRLGRLFGQQKSLAGEHQFAWNDDGIALRSSRGTSTLRRSDYHDWLRARAIFIFYLNDQLYHVVPERAMSAEERTDLLATASSKVGKTQR